jgi:hypothetical protein
MDTSIVVAWVAYLVGLSTAAVFFALYLGWIQIWRRRPPLEEPGTVRARRFILTLTGLLAVKWVGGIATLAVTDSHPSAAFPGPASNVISALLQIYLLVLLVQEWKDDKRKEAGR